MWQVWIQCVDQLGANADPGEYQMSEYHEGERDWQQLWQVYFGRAEDGWYFSEWCQKEEN